MKKIIILLSALLLCSSCMMDLESTDPVWVKIENNTDYVIVFSDVDNGGDSRFYPRSSFTIQPRERYEQCQYNIGNYDPVILVPASLTLECNGKSIHIGREDPIKRNPCDLKNWRRYSNRSKYGPGLFYDFGIHNSDIENWFGKQN